MEFKSGFGSKGALKATANAIALVAGFLPALTCWIESRVSGREELFRLWGQFFSLFPGLLGSYLRAGFYRWTLRSCSRDCKIEFLAFFSNSSASVSPGVYIGAGTIIGMASLGEGCLIGSRVSILSGNAQHAFGPDGRLGDGVLSHIHVGEHTWIGEGAILMADVGARCIVAAGAVVARPIPDGSVFGGNPSRFIGKTNVSSSEVERTEEVSAKPKSGVSSENE